MTTLLEQEIRSVPVERAEGVRWSLLANAAVMAVALFIAVVAVGNTGSLAWDAPRYANGAAMIHDWLVSGKLAHPYQFAKANYCQYPGFSIPYHPPAYPALLGIFFSLTGGVSYVGARVFIALCLGLAGCMFAALLRRLGTTAVVSYVLALLLVTTPEIALWSRDTMSEIPAAMFAIAAAYCFISWLETRNTRWCWLAFGLAEIAFLSRVTTAGLMPAWFVFVLATRDTKALRSAAFYIAGALYLAANAAWVMFIAPFSKYETVANVSPTRVSHFSWSNLSFYPSHLSDMVGWGTLIAAAAGLACAVYVARRSQSSRPAIFWIIWFASYYGFQLLLAVNYQRYFMFALPALIGLVSIVVAPSLPALVRNTLGPILIVGAFATNFINIARLPRGTVGYSAVAEFLAGTKESGNVLVAAPEVSDFIFRYRAATPKTPRRVIRADRTLAMRLSDYAGVETAVLAHSVDDVMDILRRGRVRYLVSYLPNKADHQVMEDALADNAARSRPTDFALLRTFPFVTDYDGDGRIFVWEYTSPLPSGSANLAAVVPTAGLDLQCATSEMVSK